MLYVLELAECLLTKTTDNPEVAADSKARTMPIIKFHFQVKATCIKTNLPRM